MSSISAEIAPWISVKTVVLETRKRDGSWTPTAVSLVVDDGHVYFRSYDAAGKAKRLRNFPAVRVAPSTFSGKPKGAAVPATAILLSGPDAERARAALAKRHRLLHGWLVPMIHRRKGWTTLHYELTFAAEK